MIEPLNERESLLDRHQREQDSRDGEFSDTEFGRATVGLEELDADELSELSTMVAESLMNGEEAEEIVEDLTRGGWSQGDAEAFVYTVELGLLEQPTGTGSSGGLDGWGWMVLGGSIISALVKMLGEFFK